MVQVAKDCRATPKYIRTLVLLMLCILSSNYLKSQCTNGSQPECACETAEVLCTIDELDGFTFSMDGFIHPDDGPSPLCVGGGCSCVPNNPTWFAFVAWCTEIDMNVIFSNCQSAPGQNTAGVQVAIYASCNLNNPMPIDCNVTADDCDNTDPKELNLTDLIIGDVYYFLVDGCSGATCDIEIDVIGECGDPEIEDWTNDLEDMVFCVGEEVNIEVDDLDGANQFHWYLDGDLIDLTGDNNIDVTWDTPGTFEFCVDASNNPCVPVENDPEMLCSTITVLGDSLDDFENPIDGPTVLCQGESGMYTVDEILGATNYHWFINGNLFELTEENFNELIANQQGGFELCVDVSAEPCVNIDDDPDQICLDISVLVPEAGDIEADPEELCPGEVSVVTISNFSMIPGSETLILVTDENGDIAEIFPPTSVDVTTDECEIIMVCTFNSSGDLLPSVGDNINDINCDEECCDLECITIDFTDDEAPQFPDGPADISLVCLDDLAPFEMIPFTDNCSEDGLADGTEDITTDPCMGGTVTRIWEQEDDCGNIGMHQQTITIEPVPMAEFVMIPVDESFSCIEIPSEFPPLMFTNAMSASCLIEGEAMPEVVEDFDPFCGGTIMVTWTFVDDCGRELTHVQNNMVQEAEPPVFIGAPADVIIGCDEPIPPAAELMYSNSDFACPIEGSVMPTLTDNSDLCGGSLTYEWIFTDPCGRTITHSQTIMIEEAEEPMFVDAPTDMMLTCGEALPSFEDLSYTNNIVGACLIEGTATPVVNDNSTACGGTIEVVWEAMDQCGNELSHTQSIIIDPPPPPTFINPPGNSSTTCNNIPTTAPNLTYSNNFPTCLVEGQVAPQIIEDFDLCGGTISYLWDFTDDCGNSINHLQVIEITPAPPAVFQSLPLDMEISCADFESFGTSPISYTNGLTGDCSIVGEVEGIQQNDVDFCGGVVEFLYSFTDDCDRTISHTQLITVLPAAQASFLNLPENMTLACDENDFTPDPLDYTNGASGNCEIAGTIDAITSGSADECGGVVSYIYTFTDDCGRTISHTQVLTFLPASDPEWLTDPVDMQLDCDNELPDDLLLEYDNGESFPCIISDFAEAEVEETDEAFILTWTFTNECTGNTITNMQTLTKSTVVDWDEDFLEFNICENTSLDLSAIGLVDLNDSNPVITYHTDIPPDVSNQFNDPVVTPDDDETYYIFGTNSFGCSDLVEVFIEVDRLFVAGSDNAGALCTEEENLNLFDFISNDADFAGDFFQISGPDLNIGNPESINISNAEAGIYVFNYVIEATDFCPESVAEITIEIYPMVAADILSVLCSSDFQTYMVEISNNNFDIDISVGEIISEDASSIVIANIPINTTLEIEIEDNNTDCETVLSVSPPNCNCPDVMEPQSNGDQLICFGDPTPELSVTLSSDQTANWYDEPTGGNLLASGTSSFQPTETSPGVYTFFVESESLNDVGCVSVIRIPIQLEIIQSPQFSDLAVSICDTDTDGVLLWDIETLRSFIGYSQTETAQFYLSQTDAENETNPVITPFLNNPPFSSVYFVNIQNSAECSTIIQLDVTVFAKPSLEVVIGDETCFEEMDGQIEIINFDPSGSYTLNNDMVSQNLIQDLPMNNYELIYQDSNGCADTLQLGIESGTDIQIVSLNVDCMDGGTNTDPSDDFTVVTFVISSSSPSSSGFDLLVENNNLGNFTYGIEQSINLPSDMSTINLQFIDVDNDCLIEQVIGPLNPCSTNCVLSADVFEAICNDGGSDADPSDDFYEINFLISAINGSSTNRYNVSVNGTIVNSFEYGVISQITLPADGNIVNISLIDAEDQACSINESFGPLDPCSNSCVLTPEVSNIVCQDNGSDDDNSDDIFFFDIIITSLNAGNNWQIESLSLQGEYGVIQTLGPFNISDGDLFLNITDLDDQTCIGDVLINPPAACSNCNQEFTISEPAILSCTEPQTSIMVNPSEQAIYSWSGPDGFTATTQEIMVSVPGVYEVLISYFNGCTQSGSVEVFADNDIPIALAGPDQVLTCGITEILLDASGSSFPAGATFEWTDDAGVVLSTELTFLVTETGSYFFMISDPITGCNSALEEVMVTQDLSGPSSFITADPNNVLDCTTSSVTLSSPQEPGVEYTWEVNGVPASEPVVITIASDIRLIAFDTTTGCDSETTLTVLDLGQIPPVELISDGVIPCEGGSVCINVTNLISDDFTYSWTNEAGQSIGLGGSEICVTVPGVYTVLVEDIDSGCAVSGSINVDGPILVEATLPELINILPGESGELTLNVSVPLDDIAEIIWSPSELVSCQNCLTTSISNAPNGQIITVEVISTTACRSTASTSVSTNAAPIVTIPNIIYTGSDTGNQQFTLYGNDQVEEIEEMRIFDRWGELVFTADAIPPSDPSLGWDGTFRGQDAVQGVYVYLIRVRYTSQETEFFGGDLTLLRN